MEQDLTTGTEFLVALNAYDVPETGITIRVPKFWLEKNRAMKIELCENSITKRLEIRVKERLPELPANVENGDSVK